MCNESLERKDQEEGVKRSDTWAERLVPHAAWDRPNHHLLVEVCLSQRKESWSANHITVIWK